MSTLRAALEDALAANPDDLATHMAYADHLVELGDPRGEFIQVQLALEDPRRTPEERQRLRGREQELLDRHQREWIGEAADVLLNHPDTPAGTFQRLFGLQYYTPGGSRFGFARGWLDTLVLPRFSTGLAEALGRCPTIRLLRHLTIEDAEYEDHGQEALARWPCLDCVRHFQIGPAENCHVPGEGLLPVVAAMKRVEELYLYAHRR